MYYEPIIPRVIFQYYPRRRVTSQHRKKIRKLIRNNIEWGYLLITNADVEEFLAKNRKALRKFRESNNKKELVKKYVLYNYGGAFVDIDECNVKLDDYSGFVATRTFTISPKGDKRILNSSFKTSVKMLISEICQSR